MISLFNCLLLLTLLLTFILLSASSDLASKGDKCFKVDSCFFKTAIKTCSCESDCHAYGTCCHDMNKPLQNISKNAYQCYSRRTMSPVLVKRSCVKDFRGHVGDKLGCFDDDQDEMDITNNLLMTNRETKITYWNKHCATCSNEVAGNLQLWNIVVLCPSIKNVDKSLIRRNLTFDQDKLQWVLQIGEDVLRCAVKFSPPSYIDEIKHCTPNVIKSCPDDYTNEEVSRKCSEFYAERKLRNSDIYFKNIHCAICNGADVKELECPGMYSPEDSAEESDFREMLEVVFTNDEWQYKGPGKEFKCSAGYGFDPFRKRCRTYEFKEPVIMIPNSANPCIKGYYLLLVALLVAFLS